MSPPVEEHHACFYCFFSVSKIRQVEKPKRILNFADKTHSVNAANTEDLCKDTPYLLRILLQCTISLTVMCHRSERLSNVTIQPELVGLGSDLNELASSSATSAPPSSRLNRK